jgi:hypothetical protein
MTTPTPLPNRFSNPKVVASLAIGCLGVGLILGFYLGGGNKFVVPNDLSSLDDRLVVPPVDPQTIYETEFESDPE